MGSGAGPGEEGKGRVRKKQNDEKGSRDVDTSLLDPQGSFSIHSSAFWDEGSLKDRRKERVNYLN